MNAIHRAARRPSPGAPATRPRSSTVDGLEYREALQVVRIEGGVANNVVPDACDARREPAHRTGAHRSRSRSARCYELLGDADTLEVLSASSPAPPNLVAPARAGAGRCRCARRAPEARLDRRRAVRRARHPRVQLRAGRSRAGAHRRGAGRPAHDLTRAPTCSGAFLGLRAAATA